MGNPEIREGVISSLMNYLDTDTIWCVYGYTPLARPDHALTPSFPADHPPALVRLQKEHWDPLISWMKDKFGVDLVVSHGISPAIQTPETLVKLRSVVEKFNIWELAAFERTVYATKSFVIGLALVLGRISAHEAALASHVEVASQIERWGEVEDTHDVDYQDIRRALGSAAVLLAKA